MTACIQVQLHLCADVLQSPYLGMNHIINNPDHFQIGTISLNSLEQTESFKLSPKRKSAEPLPQNVKKPKSLPKSKSDVRPLVQNTPAVVANTSPKIDVTSMMKVVQSMGSKDKTYQCSFCGSGTTLLSSMKRHIESKHLPSTVVFNCRSCSYSSKYKHDLKKHYMKTHNMPEPAAQGMLMCWLSWWSKSL